MNVSAQQCDNCYTVLHGDFCHQCGQEKKSYIRNVSGVVTEFFGEFSNWDTRVWRTLVPLHTKEIIKALQGCSKVLIVDECRRRGSLSEELFTALHEAKPGHFSISRLCAEDSFIPLGAAAYAVLPSKQQIVQQALSLLTVATEQVML